MDERTETEVAFASGGDDLFDNLSIGELDLGSRGIGEQFLDHVADQLFFIGEEQLLVFIEVAKRTTVGRRAARLDVESAAGLLPGIVRYVDGRKLRRRRAI